MNPDCLKLTCYFGERHRTPGGFVADQLLDIFGRAELATSIMMRGVEGFGFKHHLRTDASLTLSEDLPAAAVAVDLRPRIEAVLDEVLALPAIGLTTLERARLVTGPVLAPPPDDPTEATRLTVYLGRQDRVGAVPAFVAVCRLLQEQGIAGATVLLGVDGTVRGRRQRARFFSRNADVPMMVLAVGPDHRVAQVLPALSRMLPRPLLTLERVRICKQDGQLFAAPQKIPATDQRGRALFHKLSIFTNEDATRHGQPIHRAVTRALRAGGARGSTTLRGVWGFHDGRPPQGDRPFQLGRNVPTLTVVVDTPDRVDRIFPIVDEFTRDRGLVISELVPAARVRTVTGYWGELELADHRW